MMRPDQIARFLLRELRTLRRELEAYPDERQIWAVPDGLPNSAGTLALHLAGNLSHYVGTLMGGTGYVRDREYEFSARDLSRAELLDRIGAAERAIDATLPAFPDDKLAEPFFEPLRGRTLTTGDFLLQLLVHLGYHLGQVSYHRRVLTGDRQGVDALSVLDLLDPDPPPNRSDDG